MIEGLENSFNSNVTEVRPHHIHTILLFWNVGPGLYYKTERMYGERWTEEVSRRVSEAKNKPDLTLRLIEGADFICELCRYRKTSLCSDAKVYDSDAQFSEKHGFKIGEEYSIEDIKKMSTTNFH